MLGFVFRVAAGAVKMGVKYVIVPAVVSVAVAMVAEAMAERIRTHTPAPGNGMEHRRSRKDALRA